MMAPLALSTEMGFLSAVILGIFFGFFLERGGLGNPHKLTGVFYLRDFAVPQVMFTAIVVAAFGLYLFSDLHLIDLKRVWIVPTFFWPQIVGGSLFGIGFYMSGYCPGTAMVGVASGRMDALVSILGIGIGTFIFALFYPLLEGFYGSSKMGGATLPDIFHLNHWIVFTLILGMAVGMFYLMESYCKKSGKCTSS